MEEFSFDPNTSFLYHQGHGKLFKQQDEYVLTLPEGQILVKELLNDYKIAIPNTFVYLFSCQSYGSVSVREAFVRAGASAYVGWIDKAPATYNWADKVDRAFWTDLLDGKTEACTALDNLYQHCVLPVKVNAAAAYMDCWGNWRFPSS